MVGQGELLLEIGCGHSMLPTLWKELGMQTIVLDRNRKALEWQIGRSVGTADTAIDVVLADMRYLPFRDQSVMSVSCISAIEHIPGNGDVEAASEIGRILRVNGMSVISLPLAPGGKSYVRHHWATGIPPLMQRLLGPCLPAILTRFQIDRTSSYFERFFSMKDLRKRIVTPSGCVKRDYFTLKSGPITKLLHQKLVPQGFLAILEYLIASSLSTAKRTENADAIVIKLRKVEP